MVVFGGVGVSGYNSFMTVHVFSWSSICAQNLLVTQIQNLCVAFFLFDLFIDADVLAPYKLCSLHRVN